MVTTIEDNRSQWRLGEILIQNGWITWNQLEEGLSLQKNCGGFLGEILIDRGYIQRENVLKALALQFGIPYVRLSELSVQEAAIQCLPKRMAYEYQIMPLAKKGATLLIAVSDPIDRIPMLKIQEVGNLVEIRFVLADPEDIRLTITKFYGPESDSVASADFRAYTR